MCKALRPLRFFCVLALIGVGMSACDRNTFDYAKVPAPEGKNVPPYTFNPDINNPGVSKPADAQ